jgi:23S rRNA pseudouridine2605 synthase
MDLVGHVTHERILPVGRLDRNTTGLLLLTNDGELAQKLTHPSNKISKVYHVMLDRDLTKNHFNEIMEGIELEDGIALVDELAYPNPDDKRELGIELHQGKNRIVRRIFEHFEYKVDKLDRVVYAGLTKLNLPRGKWRFLTPLEIRLMKTSKAL